MPVQPHLFAREQTVHLFQREATRLGVEEVDEGEEAEVEHY